MSVTQDYKLLTTWCDLLAARVAFFEPLGTHTSLVREIKAELKLTEATLAAADAPGACGARPGDCTVVTFTSTERAMVEAALAMLAAGIGRDLDSDRGGAVSVMLSSDLAATQSAYAKVRA